MTMQINTGALNRCEVCPRLCKVDRNAGQVGFCKAGSEIKVAHYGPHFGEEPPITGTHGSGNIFFSHCNMRCIFCQNYQISHDGKGRRLSADRLVEIFFELQEMKCHNINLVTPTPYVPLIAGAVEEAKKRGIGIPFIYNTNGYDSVTALKMLEGLIDIYLPDMKYWNPVIAEKLSGIPPGTPYPEYAKQAILEMKRQVGDLVINNGIAQKGLLVRHLVLPGGLAGSRRIMSWIGDHLGKSTWIGLMSQYVPLHQSHEYPLLQRRIRKQEYAEIMDFLVDNGFENVFVQELDSAPLFVPDFDTEEPFLIHIPKEG